MTIRSQEKLSNLLLLWPRCLALSQVLGKGSDHECLALLCRFHNWPTLQHGCDPGVRCYSLGAEQASTRSGLLALLAEDNTS